MTSFYDLPLDSQAGSLKKMACSALEHWGIDAGSAVTLIKYRENAVFSAFDAAAKKKYAVRIHRAGYHSDDELRSELQWMAALSDCGILTPDVYATLDGQSFRVVQTSDVPEPRQCDILAWVEGSQLGTIEGSGTQNVSAMLESYNVVGSLQAKLHNQSSSWSLPSGFVRHSWDVDGLIGKTPFWGPYLELAALSDHERNTVLKACKKLESHLNDYGQSSDRYGLIHADFLPENLIVSDDGIRVIDFDDAGFGWHVFDIATALFYHLNEAYFDDLKAAIVDGYRGERALSTEHTDMIHAFLLARGITYLSWVHTRKETETAKALTPLIVSSVMSLAEDYLNS